jgi:hypothetical protein
MHRSRSVVVGLLAIALSLSTGGTRAALGLGNGSEPLSQTMGTPKSQVTLSAAHRTTSWDDRVPERLKFDLPLLYLHREREGTAEADRTLAIGISGLAGQTDIEIEVVSRHVDISTGEQWTETKSFPLPNHPCASDDPCTFEWTFDPATTPSDLYYLRVKDSAGDLLWENPHPDRPDFVMLDTWDVGLDGYTVRVVYATLFPFARGQTELENRLPPNVVTAFIEYQFVPIIVDTWNSQFHAWGFDDPIHPNWDSDKVVEIIVTDPPFALFDGTGTYSRLIVTNDRPYPECRIWWLASNNSFQVYDSLENSYRAVFAHEFFHLMQRNVLLPTGRPRNRWQSVFIEGQGKFAPSVQHPDIEMSNHHVIMAESEYFGAANRFLALRLNASYRDLEADPINKYDAALYWRFLYEQFGDMGIIRAALEEMAVHYAPDIVVAMGTVMDSALARLDGPFHTFEGSLVAFARANYALRLESGRCAAKDLDECGEYYYDPNELYVDPPLEAELDYDGTSLAHGGSIPSSFGMDFLEVDPDLAVHNRPLVITFQGEGTVARFDVQIWKLSPGGARPRAITLHPEIIPQNSGKAHVYVIPHLDITTYNRLAIIITRLDADETADPVGEYTILLHAGADSGA